MWNALNVQNYCENCIKKDILSENHEKQNSKIMTELWIGHTIIFMDVNMILFVFTVSLWSYSWILIRLLFSEFLHLDCVDAVSRRENVSVADETSATQPLGPPPRAIANHHLKRHTKHFCHYSQLLSIHYSNWTIIWWLFRRKCFDRVGSESVTNQSRVLLPL